MKNIRERVSPLVVLIMGSVLLVLLLITWMTSPPLPASELPAGSWLSEDERPPVDISGEFKTLNGDTVRLESIPGKVLFLNLWATWCGPCRAEMPSMASLHEEFASKGLEIVAVSDESPEVVRNYLQRNPYPFTILLDPESQLMRRFELQSVPFTLIMDNQHRLVYAQEGARQWDTPQIKDSFHHLLRE